MSTTRRSWEFAAVPLTVVLLGFLGVIMWAFTSGLWAWVALGIVLLATLTLITVAYMARPHHPSAPPTPALPEGAARHLEDGVRRILVVADDACTAGDLDAAIRGGGRAATEAFVLAPPLGSRTDRWTSDDRAYEEARRHLDATLSALAQLGVKAAGHVGSHDPLQAVEDGLREFPADEILFAVHGEGERSWLEEGVVEAARTRYPLPVRDLVVAGS